MILGINAFNISSGGGITHLKELLDNSDPRKLVLIKLYYGAMKKH